MTFSRRGRASVQTRGGRFLTPLTAAAILLTQFASIGTSGAAPTDLCGTTVTASMTLTRNLRCNGDGLRVAADGVVIDLGGHAIVGLSTGTGIGIAVDPAVQSVTIRNGTVRGFATDVQIGSSSFSISVAAQLTDVALKDATTSLSLNSASVTIRSSRINSPIASHFHSLFDVADSHFGGVTFELGPDLPGSRFVDNEFVGGGITAVQNNLITITGNRFTGAATAVSLLNSNNNIITGNRFSRNGVGLQISHSIDGGGSHIEANDFTNNAGVGAIVDRDVLDGTDIHDNVFRDNGAAGLWVRAEFPGKRGLSPALVRSNRFVGNGFAPGAWVDENGAVLNEGAHIAANNGAGVVLSDNVATGNAGAGIDTVGVTDGGGNRARRNGGPSQCAGLAC